MGYYCHICGQDDQQDCLQTATEWICSVCFEVHEKDEIPEEVVAA